MDYDYITVRTLSVIKKHYGVLHLQFREIEVFPNESICIHDTKGSNFNFFLYDYFLGCSLRQYAFSFVLFPYLTEIFCFRSNLAIYVLTEKLIQVLICLIQVMDVYMGPNGLLHSSSALQPWLFIDSSTIDPLTSRKISLSVSGCALKEKLGTSM